MSITLLLVIVTSRVNDRIEYNSLIPILILLIALIVSLSLRILLW